jgi:integrase
MKITPILYSRPLSNGLYQIKIRISDKGKTHYHTTDIEIEKNKWDDKQRRVKELKSFPLHKEYNEKIDILLSILKGDPVKESRGLILTNSHQFDVELFLEFFKRQIEILVAQEKYTSYKKYKVVLNHLLSFKQQYPFQKKIDREFLDEFKIFLFKTGTIKQNGFYAYFKVFRTFIYKIVDSGHPNFKSEHNPFLFYKLKEERVQKAKLSRDQLNKIINLKYNPHTPLGIARNLFLFSFYSGGMRVADLLTLKWKNLIDARVVYTMRKTKKVISLPLNFRQIEILLCYLPDLNKLKGLEDKVSSINSQYWSKGNIVQGTNLNLVGSQKKNDQKKNELISHPVMKLFQTLRLKMPEEYIFPPLLGYKNPTKTALDKMISSKTAIYNDNLKKISLESGLAIKLSSHIARHTFSDLMRVSGAGLIEISNALGHSDLAVTQKYLNSLDLGSMDDALNDFYGNNF